MTQNGSAAYTYDGENRIVSTAGYTYTYDADGKRIKKHATADPNNATYYYYGPGSTVLAERTGAGVWTDYIFAGGKRVAKAPAEAATTNTEYYHSDHLGTASWMTNASGAQIYSATYLPYGYELNASGSTANHYKFTGKERDAESNLDYFGARYYGGTQGRFMTPDAPFADQHPDDPQSWNLYSYVRNNPHSYVDPSGNACFALNRGSAYCARASEYGKIDAQVSNKTRFFAAASAVSQSLANTDITIASRVKVSGSSQGFLSRLGSDLRIMNVGIAASIKNGSLGGENLDARIVHMEQTKVQESLDDLKKSSADEYNTLIAEANAALNPTGLSRDASTFLDTDKAFMQVLDEVRRDLGRDIDFSKQSDREAIGNALIEHVRKTGGCDVAGDKLKGC